MYVRLTRKELETAIVEYLKKRGAVIGENAKWGMISTSEGMTVEVNGIDFPVQDGPYR